VQSGPVQASPLVRLRGVGKRYANGTEALAGLDLEVRAGEFLSLLGPSGCGKSTVLRLIAGLTDVTAGTIERRHGHDLGFVFQEATLMPWATALQNVLLPLKLKRLPSSDAAEGAAKALAAMGLEAFGNSYPRELSGGMRMRVSIARALVTEPRLLLMDEPFAALDEITRHRLNDDLLALWAERRFTVVFVTHSVFESVYLSQRVAVMSARPGRVIASIPTEAAVPRHAHFRTSRPYAEACEAVSAELQQAIAA
jgi:NitT/TauT family transport system ATP-binding protein